MCSSSSSRKRKENINLASLSVGVVFGGTSGEHEVSLAGAQSVISGLQSMGARVRQFGITKEGSWVQGDGTLNLLLNKADRTRLPGSASLTYSNDGTCRAMDRVNISAFNGLHCVFPVIHGIFGEDGGLQSMLEGFGIPFIGCSSKASSICFNKTATKAKLVSAGINVVPGFVVSRDDSLSYVEHRRREMFGSTTLFVKPVRSGSSIGVSRVLGNQRIEDALSAALEIDNEALVEKNIVHDEIVVGVAELDGKRIISPPGLCAPVGDLYTYAEKYIVGNKGFCCPAPLESYLTSTLQTLASNAFDVLHCTGVSRIDFFIEHDSEAIYINEVNTIPGFTASSVYPQLMKAAGVPFNMLLHKLVTSVVSSPQEPIAAIGENS